MTPAEADRFGITGQIVGPKLPVLRPLIGGEICAISLKKDAKPIKLSFYFRRTPRTHLTVDLRNASSHQPHRVAVHDDVVIARVPKKQIVRRFEQREPKQWPACWIDRSREIVPHPRLGRGTRVRPRANVDRRQCPSDGRQNLAWLSF